MREARAAERDRGPEDEVPDCLRDENVTGSGEIRYSSGDLDGDTADVLTSRVALAAVQAGTSVVSSRAEVIDDRTRAPDGPGRSVEDDQDAAVVVAPHRAVPESLDELDRLDVGSARFSASRPAGVRLPSVRVEVVDEQRQWRAPGGSLDSGARR